MRTAVARPHWFPPARGRFVLAAEALRSPRRGCPLHPDAFGAAVILDLSSSPPSLWWRWWCGRRRRVPGPSRASPCLRAFCALLFGREVRLLALPLELALIWWRWRPSAGRCGRAGPRMPPPRCAPGSSDALGDSAAARAAAREFAVALVRAVLLGPGRAGGLHRVQARRLDRPLLRRPARLHRRGDSPPLPASAAGGRSRRRSA